MRIKLPYVRFMDYSKQGNWLSIVLTVLALLLITFRGFNFGLELTGGATIELRYEQACRYASASWRARTPMKSCRA